MKTIALFDDLQGGHHLTYLRLFSKTLLELGYQVMTFCSQPDEVSTWIAINCPKQSQQFQALKVQEHHAPTLPILGKLPQPLVTLLRWQYSAEVIQKASSQLGYSPDLVFFNWLDKYFSNYLTHHIIDRVFPYNWSGLYFHPSHTQFKHHVLPIFGQELIHYAAAKSSRCRGIAVLNEFDAKKIQSNLNNPVIIFPDLTDESPPDPNYTVVKEIREKAGTRKIVGLFGLLSKRKGLLTLLETAQKSVIENWFFVFAGHLYESDLLPEEISRVLNFVNSQPNNCFFHLERIPTEAQFNSLIDVCDILFAAYHNFPSSSNILTKAAVFQKPVIVSDGFCMSERVKKFRLGLSIPEEDVNRCIEALHYLFHQIETKFEDLQPDFETYKALHSLEYLQLGFKTLCKNKNL
ncbi:glycosyltransferase family 1 protein [Scytonema sp. UIC 10036]|uniref:glycosyltransferase family 1 protein n=1 Tax=Scytonema sp. UIC 10036 TaxID=2304196 RepID=UPI0012DA9DC0|nr:glycosyltransferase family 1 protein [Scytonema sp. UIC 10036]MUG96755.1 glycosyltransferase family 1 protein [Scytonema sp. UIC 10036]